MNFNTRHYHSHDLYLGIPIVFIKNITALWRGAGGDVTMVRLGNETNYISSARALLSASFCILHKKISIIVGPMNQKENNIIAK